MMMIVFFLLSCVSLGAVIAMIVSRNQAYSALFLVLAFAALGGLFGLLGSPFMAAVQIIIYAGAIMVLFIFIIMMIQLRESVAPERKRWTIGLAAVISVLLLGEIAFAAKSAFAGASPTVSGTQPSTTDLGRLLFTKYLYPFEITSILIIAALVGAITLAKKSPKP